MVDKKDVNGATIVGSIFSLGNDSPFHFYSTEVPSELANGTENVLAVHRFSGDLRTIDSFGGHPEPLTWNGILFSINDVPATNDRPAIPAQLASERSETLYQLSKLRTPVKLRFHNYTWTVLIRSYKPTIHSINKVTYTITCEVLAEDLRPQTNFLGYSVLTLPKNPFAELLNQFLGFMTNFLNAMRLLAALAVLTKLLIQALKDDPGAFLLGGLSMLPGGKAIGDFMTAAQGFSSAFDSLKNDLVPQFAVDMENGKPYNTLDSDAFTKILAPQAKAIEKKLKDVQAYTLKYGATATTMSERIVQNVKASADLQRALDNIKRNPWPVVKPAEMAVSLTSVQNSLNKIRLMQKTFEQITTPKVARKITLSNPNLYELSAKYYGDLQHWKVIASANALHDPVPPAGTYTLIIPDANVATDNYSARQEV
jgi:hypothetical protein